MSNLFMIDTHTGGEPTRVVLDVQPDPSQLAGLSPVTAESLLAAESPLAAESTAELWAWLRGPGDWVRQSILSEPRGCGSMVGALVGPPDDEANLASVVFFNNHGYLGMCGHGLIGVVEALRFARDLKPGSFRFETPVGIVRAELGNNRQVTFENVTSYRYRRQVTVQVTAPGFWSPSVGQFASNEEQVVASEKQSASGEEQSATISLTGDIAYGGNWFFLIPLGNLNEVSRDELLHFSTVIKDTLAAQGITGADGAEIDHVELCGPSVPGSELDRSGVRGGRNFVLCPGGHYDRSPCGTGTSAKLACLADDGTLEPGEVWVQESIIGSQFKGTYRVDSLAGSDSDAAGRPRRVLASITGRAFVTGTTNCLFDPEDPFRYGLPGHSDAGDGDLSGFDESDAADDSADSIAPSFGVNS